MDGQTSKDGLRLQANSRIMVVGGRRNMQDHAQKTSEITAAERHKLPARAQGSVCGASPTANSRAAGILPHAASNSPGLILHGTAGVQTKVKRRLEYSSWVNA